MFSFSCSFLAFFDFFFFSDLSWADLVSVVVSMNDSVVVVLWKKLSR